MTEKDPFWTQGNHKSETGSVGFEIVQIQKNLQTSYFAVTMNVILVAS